MSGRPVIGRDYYGRTRTARTLEDAFGYGQRGGLHAGRHRRPLDLVDVIGNFVITFGLVFGLITFCIALATFVMAALL